MNMGENEIRDVIWNNLDRLRGDINLSNISDSKILKVIEHYWGKEKSDTIFEDVEMLTSILNTFSLTAPLYVYEFINKLIKSFEFNTVFDPWLTISSPVLHIKASSTLHGACINSVEFDIINELFKEKSENFKLGDILNVLSETNNKVDLVLSFPPFGMRTPNIDGQKSHFDLATTLMFKCSEKVNNNGKLIFLVSNSFFGDTKAKEEMVKLGLFVEAVFSIPLGAFAPKTNIASNLILVSKINNQKLFVAEISKDADTNETILHNFYNRKEGRVIQLGQYTEFIKFRSFSSLVSEIEMHELAKRMGYPSINLSDISRSINEIKVENLEEVEHLDNSIYIPKTGNSPVVSSLSELKIKPNNYFQVQLNEAKVNSIYLANYFNTSIGKKLRGSIESGTSIMRISKSQLLKCNLYLPELSSQVEIVEVDNRIQQFSFRLDELKRSLWGQPNNFKVISKDLKSLNKEDKLENWIDKLPFPISSILWLYYATKDDGKKIEHLFHFFEAFSEFLSMIMLSALVQDTEFYKKESYKWIGKEEKFQNWYLRATFGNWNNLTSNLSKAIRSYLSQSDLKIHCKNLFGNPSDSFLSMITNKGIINILFEVASLRNKWKGHGGITGEDENAQRVLVLEQQLNEFRKIIADSFDDIRILVPTTGVFEEGLFTFNAKELIGARTPFNEISINSLIPLDRKKLYLCNSNQSKPLELLPFIKYIEATEAIYFYTSIESKDVRWISYHFDKESELNQPAENDMFEAFNLFKL